MGKGLKRDRSGNCDSCRIYNQDYTRLSIADWIHVDEVLQRMAARNTVWYCFDGFIPNVGGQMPISQLRDKTAQDIYIKNVVARLAAYWNMTWNIAFQWCEFLSAARILEIADFVKSIDPLLRDGPS